ncbi:MAG: BT_3928 family protein [Dysgonamonadaceae bacterium]
MANNKVINVFTLLSRLIIGITFTFSGFVKSVDPLGTAYKIQDYFIALNLTELYSLSLILSVILSVGEFLLGVFILLGLYRKVTSVLVVLFMIIMAPLTLWIALENPVKDCGCFGDALIISNWQTFYKNIVLSVCAILLLVKYKNIKSFIGKNTELIVALFTIIFGFSFALYNIIYSPVLDFRPYKIGSHLSDKMNVDHTMAGEFENIFVYEKEGQQKEFTEDNYPWDDTTWTFVNMETRMVKEGIKPEIEDFHVELVHYDDSVKSFVNNDITATILEDSAYAFWMISYLLEDAETKYLNQFKDIAEYAAMNNYNFYCITSSPSETIKEWGKMYNTNFIFCQADERMLKTIIRSNPGLLLVKNGTVINKWSDNKLPKIKENDDTTIVTELTKEVDPQQRNIKTIVLLVLLFIGPILIIKGIENKLNIKNK